MAMNLKENKIEKYETQKKKKFSWVSKKKVKKNNKKPITQKKIKQSKPVKKIAQPVQQKKITPTQQKQPIAKQKSEKWVRKESKKPISEDKLNYQRENDYEKKHSQYIKNNPENVLVHWRGPDFEHYPHSKKYYTIISIVIASIILYAAITGGIIMAFLFALIWLVGYLQLSRRPSIIDFAITYDGILVDDEMFDFEDIKSFWIFYEPPHTRIISLHVTGSLRPYLHIPLHQVDPVIIHQKLTEFVPEEKQEQNMVDIAERLLHM